MERSTSSTPPTTAAPESTGGNPYAAPSGTCPTATGAGSTADTADNCQGSSIGAADGGQQKISRCASAMQHISFEMALASGHSSSLLSEILKAALDLAAGRRR